MAEPTVPKEFDDLPVEERIEYVHRLAAVGVDNVMCLIQMGTLTQEQQLETIRIWGDSVIPHFRAETEAAVEQMCRNRTGGAFFARRGRVT